MTNEQLLTSLARAIYSALPKRNPPKGRDLTSAIKNALKASRSLIESKFGGRVYCRGSGCSDERTQSYAKNARVFKVIEYLWDFSFSRHSIPQAILDPNARSISSSTLFELLLVAESELGNKNEVCRDLLKLLETQAPVRCLFFTMPKHAKAQDKFLLRMSGVMCNHANFLKATPIWLFIGLVRTPARIDYTFHTLDGNKCITAIETVQA